MNKKILTAIVLFGIACHQEESINSDVLSGKLKKELTKIAYLSNYPSQANLTIKTAPKIEKNYQTDDFKKDSDEVLLARMILGEAEGCSKIEKIAVAYTAINRANDKKMWNGETLKDSILMPSQYSCFNKKTDSNIFLKNPFKYNKDEFLKCLEISKAILKKAYSDPTKGATHYYNPKKAAKPYWTKKLIKIGRVQDSLHIFYKE